MKKITIILLLAVGTFFSSCGNAQTTADGKEAVIESVSAQEFSDLIKEGNVQLIDVRTPGEFSEGNISGSKMINLNSSSFSEDIQKLDKNEPVYVYCRSGARSMKAASIMEKQGFTKIYNLKGGYLSWPN